METDITTINISLEALCELSQEELFVLDLTTCEIVAESPSFQNLDSYFIAALEHKQINLNFTRLTSSQTTFSMSLITSSGRQSTTSAWS